MNPLNLYKLIKNKTRSAQNGITDHGKQILGAPSTSLMIPGFMSHYHSEEFASAYPSIRPIANEYMTVLPKAIGSNGEPVQNNPILNALYHPNQHDSVVSFNEKIAVSTLVNRLTYILVWRNEGGEAKPGGDFGFKGKNIAGFTFLENPSIERREGKTYYKIGAQEFNEKEVMVLPGGTSPHNLYGGYSPTEAAVRWITLDDYIADFQKGFFENNAIPAGMFKIIAPTVQEYEDIVDMLKSRHKGAGKNNNVTYSHQPIDPNSGKPAEAQIEWIPFQQSNKEIDFKSLFEQANRRIDVSYGTSQFIKGVDDAPNYATAQVSDRNFAKRVVLPLLTRNYAQITHELNRITGGIGVAITFEYEIPAVADEEKVQAETNTLQANLINTLAEKGYSLDSIVDSFDLPKRLKLLKVENTTATIKNDKPAVDEGKEVETSPDPDKIDGVTPLNRSSERKDPKAALKESDVEAYEAQLSFVIRDNMSEQIEDAISSLDTQNAETDEEEKAEAFTDEMMTIILAAMLTSGLNQTDEGLGLLISEGLSTDAVTPYVVTEAQEKAYRDYLIDIAKSYRSDTSSSIRKVLDKAYAEGWDRNRMESELRAIMQTDEWRVKRLATSEINLTQAKGSLYSMQQITDETEVKFYKVWTHTGTDTPCEFCDTLINSKVLLDEDFVEKGGIVEGRDGGMFVNDWRDIDSGGLHANCHCLETYEVVK